tara:strand:- start:327 stop:788 length:462 start_codon:yes stop_codon:yes gene_type:complete
MVYFVGCCDNESKSSHSPDSFQSENMSSSDKTIINWLIVKELESNYTLDKTSKTYSSSKSIAGINFKASLINAQIISLQIDDKEVLNKDAIELHKKFDTNTKTRNFSDQAIWEYTINIKDKLVFTRIGSIQLSDKADKCLKVSFIISVLDNTR